MSNNTATTTPPQSSSLPITTPAATVQQNSSQFQVEIEKQSIYMHPLFPLLKFLLEKCELATVNPELLNQDSFNDELKTFFSQNEDNLKSILTQNTHIDELLLKAIQVLRIHLLELEKVNELCKDFCQRYITCLKVKLNSDSIFKNDTFDNYLSGDDDADNDADNYNEDTSSLSIAGNDTDENQNQSTSINIDDSINNENSSSHHHKPNTNSCLNNMSNNLLNNYGSNINGNTPLSQIGCNSLNDSLSSNSGFHLNGGSNINTFNINNIDFDDDSSKRGKTKRGILPKNATNIMKQWLFQHIVHPYPTEEEKKQIASQTNLTLIQVNNWFINARRRILQPMLEASNPDMAKKKKTTISSKPYQNNRYWPQSLANISHMKASTSSNHHHHSHQQQSQQHKQQQLQQQQNHSLLNDQNDEDVDEDYEQNQNNCEDKINKIANNQERSMCNALKIENLVNNDCYYNNNKQVKTPFTFTNTNSNQQQQQQQQMTTTSNASNAHVYINENMLNSTFL